MFSWLVGGPTFDSVACETSLKKAEGRLNVIQKRAGHTFTKLRADIQRAILSGQSATAYDYAVMGIEKRMRQKSHEAVMAAVHSLILEYTAFQRDPKGPCPEQCEADVASIVYAATRLQTEELLEVRTHLINRCGTAYIERITGETVTADGSPGDGLDTSHMRVNPTLITLLNYTVTPTEAHTLCANVAASVGRQYSVPVSTERRPTTGSTRALAGGSPGQESVAAQAAAAAATPTPRGKQPGGPTNTLTPSTPTTTTHHTHASTPVSVGSRRSGSGSSSYMGDGGYNDPPPSYSSTPPQHHSTPQQQQQQQQPTHNTPLPFGPPPTSATASPYGPPASAKTGGQFSVPPSARTGGGGGSAMGLSGGFGSDFADLQAELAREQANIAADLGLGLTGLSPQTTTTTTTTTHNDNNNNNCVSANPQVDAAQIAASAAEVAALSEALARKAEEDEARDAEARELAEQLEQANAELARLREEKAAARAAKELELQQELAGANTELERMRAEMEALQASLAQANANESKIKTDMESLSTDLEEKAREVSKLAEYRRRTLNILGDEGEFEEAFYCPITYDIMTDPVIAADGHSYEREALMQWLERSDSSPKTGAPLENKHVVANHQLRSQIQQYLELRNQLSGSGTQEE